MQNIENLSTYHMKTQGFESWIAERSNLELFWLPARVICHEKAENFGTLFLGAMIPCYMLIYHKYQKSCYCAPLLSVFKSCQTWKFLNSMCMSCKRFLFKQDFSNRCGMGFMNFEFNRERFLKPVYHELQEICKWPVWAVGWLWSFVIHLKVEIF